MKNPLNQLWCCYRSWNHLRKYHGLFCFSDASLQISRVILPARLNDFIAAKAMNRTLHIQHKNKKGHHTARIHCKPLGLDFFWNGRVDNNLFFMAEQEFSTGNPHCYSTSPILLEGIRNVIDVGACEGLFAFRMAKMFKRVNVHCFEPSIEMAKLIEKGAGINGVKDLIHVHSQALLEKSGYVKFKSSDSPDAGMVIECSSEDPDALKSNSLDAFCEGNGIELGPHDLIKIDA